MQNKVVILFIAVFFVQLLHAQNSTLQVDHKKLTDAANNWQVDVRIQLSENLDEGFVLELPAGLPAVPLKIQFNGNDFWLKKSDSVPVNAAVVHWQENESSLIFRFSENQLQNGNRIDLALMSHLVDSTEAAKQVSLKKILRRQDNKVEGGALIAEQTLPKFEINAN